MGRVVNPAELYQSAKQPFVSGFGLLYNWYAVNALSFAPTGWRVATKNDWDALVTEVGGNGIAGKELKALVSWLSASVALDAYNFHALGTGYRYVDNYYNRGYYGRWWTATSYDSSTAWAINMHNNNDTTDYNTDAFIIGSSVRLIKNDSTDPGSFTDPSGNVYKTVKIGSQVWLDADYRSTKKADNTDIALVTDQTAWAALTSQAYCIYP